MLKSTLFYPVPRVDQAATEVVSQAGAVLLTRTVHRVGIDRALSQVLAPWRPRWAVHDPAKVVLDLAVSLAVGGDCLADIAVLRAEPALFGLVASDPTVSRTIDKLAADADRALAAINEATASVRQRVCALSGDRSPIHAVSADTPVVIDLDATLVTAHSDKEHAAPTFKRGFGFHPLLAFIDHGTGATGEAAAALLRPGNAGANTAA
ncbi:transposase, partial [Nakamurella aerolata]|nr:IS1380 family transposase [Nakamurella aerolata]